MKKFSKIQFNGYTLLVSYNTVIGFIKNDRLTLDENSYSCSMTTKKHLVAMTDYNNFKEVTNDIDRRVITVLKINDDEPTMLYTDNVSKALNDEEILSFDELFNKLDELNIKTNKGQI